MNEEEKKSGFLNYKHAEILYPSKYPIANSLRRIVCRNKSEKITLVTELKAKNQEVFKQWKDIIEYDDSMFSNSGLRLDAIGNRKLDNNPQVLDLIFSLKGHEDYYRFIDKYAAKYTNLNDYPPMKVLFDVQLTNTKYHHLFTAHVNLNVSDVASGGDLIPKGAQKLRIKVFFDNENTLVFSGTVPLKPEYREFKISLNATKTLQKFPQHNEKNHNSQSMLYNFTAIETDDLPF